MRVGHLNVTRPDYYDRQAAMVFRQSWQQGIGAHGVTVRWSYIPPTGKQAFVGTLAVGVWPDAVAAIGAIERFAIITINGLTAAETLLAARCYDANSYQFDHTEIGTNLVITSGTIMFGLDYQGAAGVTAGYLESMTVSEFTAY